MAEAMLFHDPPDPCAEFGQGFLFVFQGDDDTNVHV
jgi:hypothetical protein